MSSVKPNDRSRQINRPQKITSRFIVAGRNSSKLLEFGKKVFDEMTSLIEVSVIGQLLFPISFGGDHCYGAIGLEFLTHPLMSIIGFVGEQCVKLDTFKQNIRTVQIVGLTSREVKACGIPESIADGVNFGAQSASATTNGLVTVFLGAPALC